MPTCRPPILPAPTCRAPTRSRRPADRRFGWRQPHRRPCRCHQGMARRLLTEMTRTAEGADLPVVQLLAPLERVLSCWLEPCLSYLGGRMARESARSLVPQRIGAVMLRTTNPPALAARPRCPTNPSDLNRQPRRGPRQHLIHTRSGTPGTGLSRRLSIDAASRLSDLVESLLGRCRESAGHADGHSPFGLAS